MALPPSLNRLTVEAFPDASDEQKKVLEQLFQTMNPFFGSVNTALSKRLTLGENLGVVYKEVSVTMPSRWQTPTFTNSWVNYDSGYDTAGYYKDSSGRVHLKGLIKNGTLAAAAFTLPVEYRPTLSKLFSVISGDGLTMRGSRLDIDSAGAVLPIEFGNAFFSLDSVSFVSSDARAPALAAPFPLVINIDDLQTTTPAKAVNVVGCYETTGRSRTPVLLPKIAWSAGSDGKSVKITAFDGLADLVRYTISLLIWA